MAVTGIPRMITNGLVLYLDAANTKSYPGSATTWTDISPSQYSGSIVNGATFSSEKGGAFSFDGTNDYIDTNFDLSWNNTNSVTVSLFLKPNSLSTYSPFIGKGPTNWEWQIIQYQQSIEFVYWDTNGLHDNGPVSTISNVFTSTSNFFQLVLVWSHVDNKHYFYKNGSIIGTINWVNASTNQNRTNPIQIGGNLYVWGGHNPSGHWNGSISQVQIYNRALSATEILQNFEATRERFGV